MSVMAYMSIVYVLLPAYRNLTDLFDAVKSAEVVVILADISFVLFSTEYLEIRGIVAKALLPQVCRHYCSKTMFRLKKSFHSLFSPTVGSLTSLFEDNTYEVPHNKMRLSFTMFYIHNLRCI